MNTDEANHIADEINRWIWTGEDAPLPLSLAVLWESHRQSIWRAMTYAFSAKWILRAVGHPAFGGLTPDDGRNWHELSPRVVCVRWPICHPRCRTCLNILLKHAPDPPTVAQIIAARCRIGR